jgi:hypothetical protein
MTQVDFAVSNTINRLPRERSAPTVLSKEHTISQHGNSAALAISWLAMSSSLANASGVMSVHNANTHYPRYLCTPVMSAPFRVESMIA